MCGIVKEYIWFSPVVYNISNSTHQWLSGMTAGLMVESHLNNVKFRLQFLKFTMPLIKLRCCQRCQRVDLWRPLRSGRRTRLDNWLAPRGVATGILAYWSVVQYSSIWTKMPFATGGILGPADRDAQRQHCEDFTQWPLLTEGSWGRKLQKSPTCTSTTTMV